MTNPLAVRWLINFAIISVINISGNGNGVCKWQIHRARFSVICKLWFAINENIKWLPSAETFHSDSMYLICLKLMFATNRNSG